MAKSIELAVFVVALASCGSSIQGQTGPAGPPGVAGATGAPGPTGVTGLAGTTGTGFDIVSSLYCSKIVGQIFVYSTHLFANGARFTTCEISDAFASYSSSAMYAAGRPGATNGYCSVSYDIDTVDVGYWVFTLSPRRAQYNDTNSPNNQQSVTFETADCIN